MSFLRAEVKKISQKENTTRYDDESNDTTSQGKAILKSILFYFCF